MKQFGLKSAIANQILRKNSSNKRLKKVGSVKLTVPSQSIKVEEDELKIPCLKLGIPVTLHLWSFYQLQSFLQYKARLRSIPIVFVEPRNTSKECSRCGSEGARIGKNFVCQCGHVDHADANAGFNIAMRPNIGQSIADRDAVEGNADIPRGATLNPRDAKTPRPSRTGVCQGSTSWYPKVPLFL